MSLKDHELRQIVRELVRQERQVTLKLLQHLRLVESRRLYAVWGYSSLFKYVTEELKYSEGAAMRRIQSMRLLREMPEFESKVEAGTLSLTVLAQAASVLKELEPAKKRETLARLENCSSRQADQVLAEIAPRPARETSESVDGKNLQVTLILTPELQAKLKLLQDEYGTTTYSELIDKMATKLTKSKPAAAPPAPAVTETRHVPLPIQRFVKARDRSCTYVSPDGKRCGSTWKLEIEHLKPFALGGTHDPDNLTLRCRAHNLLAATQAFGPGVSRLWR